MAATPKPVRKEMKILEKGHRKVGEMSQSLKELNRAQDKKGHNQFTKFAAEARLKGKK